jgi:hypothetical protein
MEMLTRPAGHWQFSPYPITIIQFSQGSHATYGEALGAAALG